MGESLGGKPVIICIETDAGYEVSTPVCKCIEQAADMFGFALFTMGFRELPGELKG